MLVPKTLGRDDLMFGLRPVQTIAVYPSDLTGPLKQREQKTEHGFSSYDLINL